MLHQKLAAAALAAAILVAGASPALAQAAAGAADDPSTLEVPDNLVPAGDNVPLPVEEPLEALRYDDNGFPEDGRGTLVTTQAPGGWFVSMDGIADPFLLYAQFVNTQRDGVLLARNGDIQDALPDGSLMRIPYGYGALKTSAIAISLVEAIILPHVSDARKEYSLFPLQDLYLGATAGFTGLLAEARYVHRERVVGYARVGLNPLGGAPWPGIAPFTYWGMTVHFGAGAQFPDLLHNLLGDNHWTVGGDLLLGFGDADADSSTPAVVWMPGVFFELEKRDLFGWAGSWAGFAPRGDFHDDPRPQDYHVRGLYARVGLYIDFQNSLATAPVKLDVSAGFRYNVLGPRIPAHRFKETRIRYLSPEYVQQVELQREQRRRRLEQSGS
jgi:hypothetical protein